MAAKAQAASRPAAQCASGVEAKPADPQHRGARGGVGHVVRGQRFAAIAQALAEHQGADQGRHAGTDVDHRSPGKVQCAAGCKILSVLAAVCQDSAAPEPMGQRTVDQRAPKDHERYHGAEFHTFGKGPADQSRSNDKEHALEEHVGHNGDCQAGEERQIGALVGPGGIDAAHAQVAEVADPGPSPPKTSVYP